MEGRVQQLERCVRLLVEGSAWNKGFTCCAGMQYRNSSRSCPGLWSQHLTAEGAQSSGVFCAQ